MKIKELWYDILRQNSCLFYSLFTTPLPPPYPIISNYSNWMMTQIAWIILPSYIDRLYWHFDLSNHHLKIINETHYWDTRYSNAGSRKSNMLKVVNRFMPTASNPGHRRWAPEGGDRLRTSVITARRCAGQRVGRLSPCGQPARLGCVLFRTFASLGRW